VKYNIAYSPEADKDWYELFEVIAYEYNAPSTAFKYVQELIETIEQLQTIAESFPIQTYRSFLKYGQFVRRINYKQMAIIYTVHGDMVYIHRIVPASMITG